MYATGPSSERPLLCALGVRLAAEHALWLLSPRFRVRPLVVAESWFELPSCSRPNMNPDDPDGSDIVVDAERRPLQGYG